MIETSFDNRVKIHQIVSNHLPEFLLEESPKTAEFLKQYYISQEFQSGVVDLAENLDSYLKVDNLTPEIINDNTTLQNSIDITDQTIVVSSTKGFPSEYGLLKIDDEIITYTGKTTNTFTGCIRGFSGITKYSNTNETSSITPNNYNNDLVFSTSSASSHAANSQVYNLSTLFLKEFYKKLKYTLVPGLENINLVADLDVNNFIKSARSFYQSKGTNEAFRILFLVLYGVNPKIIDLENYLIKPSFAKFIKREVIIVELISEGNPLNLVGQTLKANYDDQLQASISEVEILTRKGKTYYKISLFSGYDDKDLIEGNFKVLGKTKVLDNILSGSTTIPVDSTIGFANTGSLICGNNIISYTSKSVNQFFGCSGIEESIEIKSDIRSDEILYAYENGDTTKKVELRVTGSLSKIENRENIILSYPGDKIGIKNVGENILNPTDDKSFKQIIANSFIYNTSTRHIVLKIFGSTFRLGSKIEKSSLKVGDYVDVLVRGSSNTIVVSNAQISQINFQSNEINLTNLQGFTPDISKNYDIRRKIKYANSLNTPLIYGNGSIISDVSNVYSGDNEIYVSSNSLPSYQIATKTIFSTIPVSYNTNVNSYFQGVIENPSSPNYKKYTILSFNESVRFITGDSVTYIAEGQELPGLVSGNVYYIKVLDSPNKIRLYESRSFIVDDPGENLLDVTEENFVCFEEIEGLNQSHTFILLKDLPEKISPKSILKKLNITQNISKNYDQETNPGNVGILINGVEINNFKSNDKIFYGPLKNIQVINGGDNYDVVRPPNITISTGAGDTTALVNATVSGSIKKVLVDPQDFNIDGVVSAIITGGNGTGATLLPVTEKRSRSIEFDSRFLSSGGGIDADIDETITFLNNHNFNNGEPIIYDSNGNVEIGIATFKGSNISEKTLSNGSYYYAQVVNTKTVKLYPTLSDYNSGINTIGFSTSPNSGIHKFRTKEKLVLSDIKVVNSDNNYSNHQIYVKTSGISTYFNTVSFEDHHFETGDVVLYECVDGNPISGLTNINYYYVVKNDSDTFKLCDAGTDKFNLNKENFNRRKYVKLEDSGSARFHIFKYPNIEVNVKVSYGSTFTYNLPITATPIVTGSIKYLNLYEKGVNYGSKILNFENIPLVTIKTGQYAQVKPYIIDGKIVKVNVLSGGIDYYSTPNLVVNGTGSGCVLRAVILNNRLYKVIVIKEGVGYDPDTTTISVVPAGSKSVLRPSLRSLTVDNYNRFGDEYLSNLNNNLEYTVTGYSPKLTEEFTDDASKHSPIIGWAYDGNPIYGPYGYSDPTDINSSIRRLSSGYSINPSSVYDRPSEFPNGFFVEDYVFTESGDLDVYNGRFCLTPEFPNGIYAYFSTIDSGQPFKAIFPYFVGPYYRSEKIDDNWIIDQNYDFENSNLSRNTFPYKVSEKYADYEFFVESNEITKQTANVDSVLPGKINSFKIIQSGENYKVGDICYFESDESDDGGGLSAYVSKINGKNIVKFDANIEKYQNTVLEWSANNIFAYYYPYFDLFNADIITVTGIGTYISKLAGQQSCNVFRDQITLLSDMATNVVQNKIEDIYVSKIPATVSVGSTLNISGSELVSVLNIFGQGSIMRVMRSDVGYAHTQSDIIDILPNKISIPVNTTRFDSKPNSKIYFAPNQSVGIGTTPGIGISVDQTIGGVTKTVSIPTQAINIPNHPFKTGDSAILRKLKSSRSQLVVSDTESSPSFTLLTGSTKSEKIYIINKSRDLIGITTTAENAFTTNGLYIKSPIPVDLDYSIETNYNQIKAEIQKNVATITTEEEHGLLSNDQIYLKLTPKINVGIANSDSVVLNYNSDYKVLTCNTLSFNTADVDLENNKILISNHIFKTGDKVFYTCSGSPISGLIANNSYFVYKVDDDSFQLSETYLDTQKLYPNIIYLSSVGSNFQKLSLINPGLKVEKNNSLIFDVSDSSLDGYDLKLFYDSDFKKEFVSVGVSSQFSFSGVGTPGSANAKYTLTYDDSFPPTLYYNLSKDGLSIDTDSTVINSSSIIFVNNTSSGSYIISGVGTTVFNINLKTPSQYTSYDKEDTDILEYSTNSKNATGGINNLIITNTGYGYKKLPIFSGTNSDSGINANIVPYSKNIGIIKEYTITDQGFDYSSDITLRPEASIPSVIFTEESNEVVSIDIIDGGEGYSAPPSLILKNPQTNEVVDNQSLTCEVNSGSVFKININAPIKGLSSINHEVVFINNTNGIGINSIQSSTSGIVTCVLVTPIVSGFIDPPFSVGDDIFVENIAKDNQNGDGFNSTDYDYQFFKVKSFENTNPAVLEYSLAGLTTNPGIAKTSQLGYAIVIKKDSYPKTIVNQTFSKFTKGERLGGDFGNGFITLDLIVEESSNSYIKVTGKDLPKIKVGTTLKGFVSGSIAQVIEINLNSNKFEINYSNELILGWSNNIGELNNLNQVIEDNDYYQNLSYSIKSPIQYSDFVDSVNNLVHISGLKNFSDTQIESNSTVYSSTGSSNEVIVIDVLEESRVDIINNYSQSIDVDTFENKSRYLQFKNLTLTDYISCDTNRVLSIDDFSKKFSSKSNERDLFTNIFTYLEDTLYSKYLIQTTDVTNNKYQFDEVVVIFYDKNIYTLEKSSIKTSEVKLGDIRGEVDDYNTKTLRFNPSDPYNTDYDIKYVQTYFNNLNPKVVGINTSYLGSINLSGVSTSVKPFSTSNILSIPSNTINGMVANVFVFDTVRFNMNFAEVVVDSDGTNTYLSEYYFDDNVGISTNYLGYFDSTIESGLLKLKITNNTNTEILVNANIVGFGSTSLGIGTYRFNYLNQPEGSERTARFESNYSVSSGITTVLKFKTNEITSTKSLVRVSYGNTSSIHQVMCIQDNSDITLVQYPFSYTSSNVLGGIGTFGAYYSGDSTIISFYPDNVTQKITIQSYNQLIYTFNDFENESLATNNALNYGNISEFVRLAAYDGINGPRANKVDFDINHLGTPIFRKIFDPGNTSVLEKENGIINIKDHYFSTGERLIYTPRSTFIGVGETSIGIGATANSAGIVTNRLPTEVYAIKLDEDSIQLATRKDYALSGIYVTFTSSGEGNAHELEMYKKFEKTVISIDGIVQNPLIYTPVSHTLKNNGGQIGITTNYLGLSGISSISPGDLLKIEEEFVRVISVGFAQTTKGPITGTGSYEIAYVDRAQVGTSATTHKDSSTARVYRGSYNLTKNKIYFTQPPRGSARERRDFSNLPYPTSSFNGRVFLRQNYTTNFLYDDISDQFNGIDSSYTLTVQGINTTGIETGSGILFINGIFQTPSTKNNIGNNYSYTGYSGITSVFFTGITSSNGQVVTTDFDINQNQMPRGGLIVSLGSTPGLGYAPLVGASVTAVLNETTGAVVSVGLGTTDVRGSGYRSPVSIGITDPLHTGSAAVITATVGIGGTLRFNVVSGGTGYVKPTILVSEPSYENLPVTGVYRRGIGNTTTTGENLLVSLDVGASSTTGIGSTYFQVNSFRIARPGYGFLPGDVITPIGLVTDRRLNSPLAQFELTVLDTFSDTFSSWQFGELDYIDSIKNLQNGTRKRFPLYYNGQLLSFQKGENSPDIDLNAILLIFINGVIQEPGVSYEFAGGTSFVFYEAPKPDANVSIFFYRGTRNVDSVSVNVNETIKIGDKVIVRGNENLEGVGDQDPRLVEDIIGSDIIQTNIYTGQGIDSENYKFFDWEKQKIDTIINGEYVYKTRDLLESQVYPTARIIKDAPFGSNSIFVDNIELFDYEENDFNVNILEYGALITKTTSLVSAAVTAIVSTAGTIRSLSIEDPGSGYSQSSPLQIKISSPKKIGVGIGTTATATVNITNGSVTGYTITNMGLGYSRFAPPQVLVPLPDVEYEMVKFTRPSTVTQIARGFSGIITGISSTSGTGGNPRALKFFLRREDNSTTFDDLQVGYPVLIFNTNVGTGLTSIDSGNNSVVGIGTEYVDNIYYIHSIVKNGPDAVVVSNVRSDSNIVGLNTSGTIQKPVGNFSWGILADLEGGLSNVSIAVTGFTINSGLTSFPTIQRKDFGLRDNGSLRKIFI